MSRDDRRPAPRALQALNVAGLVGTTLMSAAQMRVGVSEQTWQRLTASAGQDLRFWTFSTGVRSAAVTVPLLATLATGRRPSPSLLLTAGLIQVSDAWLVARQRNLAGTLAISTQAASHLAMAWHAHRTR